MRTFITYFIVITTLQTFCQITQLSSGTTVTLRSLSVFKENIFITGSTTNYLAKSYNECNQIINPPCPGPSINYIYTQRLDSLNVLLLTYGNGASLYKSTDGGYNWTGKWNTSYLPSCFGFFNSMEGITDQGLMNNLLRTLDGGITWTTSLSPLYSLGNLEIFGDSTVIIGGSSFPFPGGEFYISKDRGRTWPNGGGITSSPVDFSFLNKDTVCVLSSQSTDGFGYNFAKSFDGGGTWQNSTVPLRHAGAVYLKTANDGYAIGSDIGNNGIILRTTDLGQTWSTFNTGISTKLTDLAFLNDSIALLTGTNGVLLRWNYKKTLFTGVKDHTSKDVGIKIFPNPIENKMYIEDKTNLQIDRLSFHNTLGHVLYEILNPSLTQGIDLTFLESGLYYVRLSNKSGVTCVKVIKE